MQKKDLTKASVTPDNKAFIDEIVNQGYFKDNINAYKFFISYGLSRELVPSDDDLSLNRTEDLFDARVDIYLELQDVIKGIFPDEEIRKIIPIRLMNAVADLAIQNINKKYWNEDTKELDMEKILAKI